MNTIPRHNTANTQYDKEPCKGDTPKAQGGMRAKPDMKPWVHANKIK